MLGMSDRPVQSFDGSSGVCAVCGGDVPSRCGCNSLHKLRCGDSFEQHWRHCLFRVRAVRSGAVCVFGGGDPMRKLLGWHVRLRDRRVHVRQLCGGPVPSEHRRLGVQGVFGGKLLRIDGPECRERSVPGRLLRAGGIVVLHKLRRRDLSGCERCVVMRELLGGHVPKLRRPGQLRELLVGSVPTTGRRVELYDLRGRVFIGYYRSVSLECLRALFGRPVQLGWV